MNPEALASQLTSEKNTTNVNVFSNDFDIRYMILEKAKEGNVNVEL
jgi:hypothetical protein